MESVLISIQLDDFYNFQRYLMKRQILKAQLYSILPTSNKKDPLFQLKKLENMLNQRLRANQINVAVSMFHPQKQFDYLYNPKNINNMFNGFDIIQIDVLNLWAIQEKLMTFTMDEISYYHKLFAFQWEPLVKEVKGRRLLIGSPGLICSDFIQKRQGPYKEQIYASLDEYNFVSLYVNHYLNRGAKNTIQSLKNKDLDQDTIKQIASFLKNLKRYNKEVSFFKTKAAYTLGFSENISNFLHSGYHPNSITFEHIIKDKPNKFFYIDAFIAKESYDPQVRQTVLKFYQFMITDEILDIYTKGLYTTTKKKTFIMPPKIDYFQKIAKEDKMYGKLLQMMKKSSHLPFYHSCYAQNLMEFGSLIKYRLKSLNVDV